MMSDLREAVSRRDAGAVEKAAHALKGSVSNFVAKEAFEAAQQLEQVGRAGELDRAGETLTRLEEAIRRLGSALAELTHRNTRTA